MENSSLTVAQLESKHRQLESDLEQTIGKMLAAFRKETGFDIEQVIVKPYNWSNGESVATVRVYLYMRGLVSGSV